MVAAEMTLTETSRTRLKNMEIVTGTVTIVTTLDWVDVGSFTPPLKNPHHAIACLATTGVDHEAFVDGTDAVFFTQTGAAQVTIFAESAESTGGD